ncbi:hypothetical protein [Nannocystis pusilla]|uniref:hypothetical protein n=1 Tax=Nannocystis pusilla TaxID=889268 RepID=UPI003DA26F24
MNLIADTEPSPATVTFEGELAGQVGLGLLGLGEAIGDVTLPGLHRLLEGVGGERLFAGAVGAAAAVAAAALACGRITAAGAVGGRGRFLLAARQGDEGGEGEREGPRGPLGHVNAFITARGEDLGAICTCKDVPLEVVDYYGDVPIAGAGSSV